MPGDEHVHRIGALERITEEQSKAVHELSRAVDKLDLQVESIRELVADNRDRRDRTADRLHELERITERHALWVKAISVFVMGALAAAGTALWSAISGV